MGLVILGDRDELHREGIQRFLWALYESLCYIEQPHFYDWQRQCYMAAAEVMQGEVTPETVARGLGEGLQEILPTQEALEHLTRQLTAARREVALYKELWENLCAATSMEQLHAWQAHAATLEQELTHARAMCSGLEACLAELQQELAARDAKIAELNRLIARQVAELDTLFGTAEEPN